MCTDERERDKPIELRSEELQDLIGRMPSCFERYGIAIMAVVVLVMFTGTFFFKYPDTLDAQIVITNSAPAATVVARTSGNLEFLNKKNGRMVLAGELLAVIANTANHEDVIQLEKIIKKMERQEISLSEFVHWMDIKKLQLGNMQRYYVVFSNAARNLYHHNTNNYYKKKKNIVYRRQEQRHEMEYKEHHLHELQKKQESICREIYLRDSMLYALGMLSKEAYDKANQIYIQSRRGAIDREVEEMAHLIQKTNDQEAILDLTNEQFVVANNFEQAFFSTLQELNMAIKNWEETYLMRSPTDGILNQMGLLGENRYVSNGENLFYVTPKAQKKPIGKALLPASGAGKVKIGQKVIVSVNNFPEEEFGSLNGVVCAISDVPTTEGNYIVDIEFPNGLNTVFHKELPSSQQYIGSARLIIKDRRLIEVFVQPIKTILSNNT